MLKKFANFRKVKAQVEAENKKSGLCSTLTLISAYLISLRPCWTAFLSILQGCSPTVPHVRTIEVLARRNSFSAASSLSRRVTVQVYGIKINAYPLR